MIFCQYQFFLLIFIHIYSNTEVSDESEQIVRGLLQLNPERRFTATQTRNRVGALLKRNTYPSSDRAVPELNEDVPTMTQSTTLPTGTPLSSRKPPKTRTVKVEQCQISMSIMCYYKCIFCLSL